MAAETCRSFLTAADLRAVCQHRGWSPVGRSKGDLVAFVEPRLLGPEGVGRAVATLQEDSLLLLHRIAVFGRAVRVGDLRLDELRATRRRGPDDRAFFKSLVGRLVNRGVVLVHDDGRSRYHTESRFARLTFWVPEAHLPLLPALPVAAEPLGQDASRPDVRELCTEALVVALHQAGAAEARWPEGLLGLLAADISLDGSRLSVPKNKKLCQLDALVGHLGDLWVRGATGAAEPAAMAALHVLGHLPEGCGCSPEALVTAVSGLGKELDLAAARTFCSEGHRAGLLVRGGEHQGAYALPGAPAIGDGVAARHLSLESTDDGEHLDVDLEASDLGAVLDLAAYSLVTAAKGRLRLSPALVELGRARDRLGELAVLHRAREVCPAYDRALRRVEALHGKTVLHQGLAVLQIDDLGLRTLLIHRLGDRVRALGGAYLALGDGALGEAETIIAKEGFSPRRVSG